MHPALLAKALDDLEVGIRASAFDAKIHGAVSFPLHISGSGLMGAIANRRMSSVFGTTFQIRSDATHAKPSKLAENYFRSPFNCRRRVRRILDSARPVRTHTSPSPQPSPLGRGRTISHRPTNQGPRHGRTRAQRRPLSPRAPREG